MIPDTDAPIRTPRALGRRLRSVPERKAAHPAEWQISGSQLVNAQGQRFRIARHGVDKYQALHLLENATIIYGEFPDLTDITKDPDRIGDAFQLISTRGDLFSVYASVYRSGSRTVLLLDYLR